MDSNFRMAISCPDISPIVPNWNLNASLALPHGKFFDIPVEIRISGLWSFRFWSYFRYFNIYQLILSFFYILLWLILMDFHLQQLLKLPVSRPSKFKQVFCIWTFFLNENMDFEVQFAKHNSVVHSLDVHRPESIQNTSIITRPCTSGMCNESCPPRNWSEGKALFWKKQTNGCYSGLFL